jgi:hypothetical protein
VNHEKATRVTNGIHPYVSSSTGYKYVGWVCGSGEGGFYFMDIRAVKESSTDTESDDGMD